MKTKKELSILMRHTRAEINSLAALVATSPKTENEDDKNIDALKNSINQLIEYKLELKKL